MKVKLIRDIPVAGRDLLTGMIMETVDPPDGKEYLAGVWVQGVNEKVRLLPFRPCEYVEVKDAAKS